MTAALAAQPSSAITLTDKELIDVLTSSLYPGANPLSIKMVLGYCKAAGLDPMQKPVHIVPMWDSKAGAMRDVVMPGVGLYRTQASRTGHFAGQSEPEFGPMITTTLSGVSVTHPEFAKVTVKKSMANGSIAEFTAIEYWIENYAVKGGKEKSSAPNAMWLKRPRGQIAKCAAAQALRLAFPEMGAQPTAEEMEGKTMHDDVAERSINPETGEITTHVFDVYAALNAVEICINPEALLKVWKTEGAKAVAAKDKAGHAALKDAVKARRAEFEADSANENIIDAEVTQ